MELACPTKFRESKEQIFHLFKRHDQFNYFAVCGAIDSQLLI